MVILLRFWRFQAFCRQKWRVAARLLVALALLSHPIGAQPALSEADSKQTAEGPSDLLFALSYRGPSNCGSKSQLVGLVREHTTRQPSAEQVSGMRVSVWRTAGEVRGQILAPGNETAGQRQRTIEGADCEEVHEALAFVIALTLDPTLRAQRDSSSGATSASRPSGDSASSAIETGSEQVPPGSESATNPKPTAPSPSAPPPTSSPDLPFADRHQTSHKTLSTVARSQPSLHLFLNGLLVSSPAPEALFGAQLGVEGVLDHGGWSSATRLSFKHAFERDFRFSLGVASFSWTSGSLELCPAQWETSWSTLGACPFMDVGVLSASGSETSQPHGEARFWLSFGAAARLKTRLLQKSLGLEIAAGPFFNTQQDRFLFVPEPVHPVPRLGVFASAGVSGKIL